MDVSQLYAPDGSAVQDYAGLDNSGLETALFGAPISQAAPELASVVDPTSLSDSSQNSNTDYSFYSDPSSYLNTADYSPVDTTSQFYSDTAPSDLSQLDPSAYDY